MESRARYVVTGVGDPLATVAGAEVAIENDATWSIINGRTRLSGHKPSIPMPQVDCPVIVIGPELLDSQVAQIMRANVKPDGIGDLDKMLAEFVSIGATVKHPSVLFQHST